MTKRSLVGIILLLVLGGVLGFYVYDRVGSRMGGTPASLKSRFATEEDWLLDEIVRDIVEMAAYSQQGNINDVSISVERVAVDNEPLPLVRVEVSVRGSSDSVSRELVLEGSLWNPQNYAELARALLGSNAQSPSASTSVEDSSLLERLLEPLPSVIETENQRVSSRLASNMLDAEAHEEAALLLGAFALREASYRFGDLRQVRCRITAHLAMARALSGPVPRSLTGEFAEATHLVILGRQEEALAALGRLSENATPVSASWVNGLYMHSTYDWRRSTDEPDTLFESMKRFRALTVTVDSTTAAKRMGAEVRGGQADWSRIVSWRYSGAASDNRFISSQLERELAEFEEVWTLSRERPMTPGAIIDGLNEPAERCVTSEGPRVIGWGTWAAFFQRHICGLLALSDEHMRSVVGRPDWAEGHGAQADNLFEGLTLYPIVRVHRTRRTGAYVEDIEGMDGTINLTRRKPELVNANNWQYMADTTSLMVRRLSMPRGDAWFSRGILVTTVFDTWARLRAIGPSVKQDQALEALREVAPRHRSFLYVLMQRLERKKPTAEQIEGELGDRVDFDLGALYWMRDALGDEAEDETLLYEKMCTLDANECIGFGWSLVRAGRDDEAAAAFEQAVREAPDRIYLCNSCEWLVHYYFDQGRRTEAMKTAEMVAETYCSGGLTTLASLYERLGRPAQAESWYRKNGERYDSEDPASYPLLGFYYRMTHGEGREAYREKLERLAGKVFPTGLEPLPEEHDAEPPRGGLLLDGKSSAIDKAGLRGGDVIVGLDGWRVRSMEQYDAIRAFRRRVHDMKLRIWRQTQYLDLDTELFNRHLHVRARTYGTPGPTVYFR